MWRRAGLSRSTLPLDAALSNPSIALLGCHKKALRHWANAGAPRTRNEAAHLVVAWREGLPLAPASCGLLAHLRGWTDWPHTRFIRV